MPLRPEDVEAKRFARSPDGYDRAEVEGFLYVLAAEQRILLETLSERGLDEHYETLGSELSSVLAEAHQTAGRLRAKAERYAVERRKQAEEEMDRLRAAAVEATDRLKSEAELYAIEVRTQAEREAREHLAEVAGRIEQLLAGEAKLRQRLYSLETMLQTMRGDLKSAAEALYPELPDLDVAHDGGAKQGAYGRPAPEAVVDLSDEAASSPVTGAGRGAGRRLPPPPPPS